MDKDISIKFIEDKERDIKEICYEFSLYSPIR
jgi:hypothetical protein